jgi:hypothetical protein
MVSRADPSADCNRLAQGTRLPLPSEQEKQIFLSLPGRSAARPGHSLARPCHSLARPCHSSARSLVGTALSLVGKG